MSKPTADTPPESITVVHDPGDLDVEGSPASKHVLWPCDAFDVTVPTNMVNHVHSDNRLNSFERIILLLTPIDGPKRHKLADVTGLPEDFVSFLQEQLVAKRYLDEEYRPTELGAQYADRFHAPSRQEKVEHAVVRVLVDAVGGKLLPYILTSPTPEHLRVEKKGSNNYTITSGSTGKPIKRTYEAISRKNHHVTPPTARSVLKILPKENSDRGHANVISVNKTASRVYLPAIVFVSPENYERIAVRTPLSSNDSGLLRELSEEEPKQLLESLRRRVNRHHSQRAGEDNVHSNAGRKRLLFSRITPRLREALTGQRELAEWTAKSSHEEHYREDTTHRLILALYAAFEHVLNHLCLTFSAPEAQVKLLTMSNAEIIQERSRQYAEHIGFHVEKKVDGLFRALPGAVKAALAGKEPQLQPLLALALASASDDTAHPLRRVSEKHPDFLSVLEELRSYRNPIAHGDGDQVRVSTQELGQLVTKITTGCVLLVPDLAKDLQAFPDLAEEATTLTKDDYIETFKRQKWQALTNLYETYGYSFSDLPSNLTDELLRAEMLFTTHEDVYLQTLPIIVRYASAVQIALYEYLRVLPKASDPPDPRQLAFENIERYGFVSERSEIPRSLQTVNPKRVRRSVGGENSTLGANLLAIFASLTPEDAQELSAKETNLVHLVGELTSLRGHGSHPPKQLSDHTLKDLRERVLRAIQLLIGAN